MKKACYGRPRGPEVTAQEFHQRATSEYKEKGVFPFCPECSERVDLYGINSPDISRFDHQDRDPDLDPLDDCNLADRNTRFKGMNPDGWDYERGERLRAEFFEDENLKTAYAFCHKMARKGNLSIKKFCSMISRADRKQVWCYANIPLWVVPYILLTLENFTQEKTDKSNGYNFHFIFDKPRGSTASALWERMQATYLKKVFSDDGKIVSTSDNPYPLSQDAMLEKAGTTGWIQDAILQPLKQLA